MRCKICDFSPTAPSLSLVQPPKGVRLLWDEKEGGWTCGNACGNMQPVDDDDEGTSSPMFGEIGLDIVEVIEGEAALS